MNTAGAADLRPDIYFHGYRLENAYLRTTETQRAEILELWRREEAGLGGVDAERASHEAVYLIRSPSLELAGVSSVALVRVKGGQRFYSNSIFIRKQDRVPFLMLAALNATRDFLRTFKHPVEQPVGMLNVNENQKLMRPGIRRVFVRNGYKYWGQTALGEDVWVSEFDQPNHPEQTPAPAQPDTSGNVG